MDKLKKIFSSGSDKESAADAERSTRSETRGTSSNTAGDSSSYGNERSSGLASSAEQKLTGNTTQDTSRSFARDDPTSASGTGTSRTGADTSSGYTGTSGNNAPISDVSTAASVKSGVHGTDLSGVSEAAYTSQPTTTEYNSSGLTGTALTDRSVGTSGSTGGYTDSSTTTGGTGAFVSGGPHQTFTGNRLDPAFTENIPSYHEEVADAHKHKSTGASVLGATGIAAAYTVTGAEAEQYRDASNISSIGYSSQSQGTSGSTGAYGSTGYSGASTGGSQGYSTGPASSTVGPHSSNLMNVVDPRVQPEPELMRGEQSSSTDNYGRDTALAGGAGAASYGSSKPSAVQRYEEDRGVSEGQSYATSGATAGAAGVDPTQYPHRADLEHHERLEDENRRASKGGALGFLHSSQRDKYDDPAERETSAKDKYFGQHSRASGEQERSTTAAAGSSHLGRDAVAVGTAGGLGGAAAYEYEKHSGTTGGAMGKTVAADYDPYSSQHAPTGAVGYDPYATEATTGPTGFATGYTGDSAGRSAATAVPVAAVATEAVPEKKHTFGFLHRKDHNKLHKEQHGSAPAADDAGDGRVIDSVTGLPMNIAKYGKGTGGTDGLKSIAGYEPGLNRERLESEGTADYDAIKKANVPY